MLHLSPGTMILVVAALFMALPAAFAFLAMPMSPFHLRGNSADVYSGSAERRLCPNPSGRLPGSQHASRRSRFLLSLKRGACSVYSLKCSSAPSDGMTWIDADDGDDADDTGINLSHICQHLCSQSHHRP